MLKNTDNPWLGLASYEYKDAYRFFGRQKELVELKTAICNNPFTTMYGISGAGKTSLINAGMLPLLEKENYLPVRIRLEHQSKIGYNSQIIMAIKNAVDIVEAEIEFGDELDIEDVSEEEKLWCFLFASKIWSSTNHQLIPVIFIDQFEEIFTKNKTEETVSRFFDCINSLQYNTPPEQISLLLEQRNKYVDYNDVAQFRMVFIMREDFLARLEDHSFDIPALRKNRRGIKRMDGNQALEVILKPCPNIVSREVALQILGKVTGKEVRDSETVLNRLSVDTSILSLFCSELYQKAAETNSDTITKELVGQFGDDIISSFYVDSMKLVSNETVEYLETHLLTYSGFRNTVALEDLTQNGIKPEELKKLAEKRLLRIETMDGTERVEFMHDVLCMVAKEHRDARREEKALKEKAQNITKTNVCFLITSIFGVLLLAFIRLSNSFVSASYIFPHVLYVSFILYEIYRLLFEKEIFKYLIVRYLVSFILALLLVPGTIAINRYVFGGPGYPSHMESIYAYIKYIMALYWPFCLCLFCSYLLEHFLKREWLIALIKTVSLLLLIIPLLAMNHNTIAIIMMLFAIFVLIPYCITKEKNAWWLYILSGVLLSFSLLLTARYSFYDYSVVLSIIIILISIVLAVFSMVRYKKKKNAKEAWNYCISLKQYEEYPFFKKTLAVLLLLFVFVCSIEIGIRMSDRETLLGIVFFAPLSYVLVGYLIFDSLKKSVTLLDIILLLLLVGIVVSQYFYGRLYWLVFIWMVSAILLLVVKPYEKIDSFSTYRLFKANDVKFDNKERELVSSKKRRIMHYFVVWLIAFFFIPVLCMGYNVFTLPKDARVFGGTIYERATYSYIKIKNKKGAIGLRDRNRLVVPIEYKKIESYWDNYYGFYDYSISRQEHNKPRIFFFVTKKNGSRIMWDCSKHLDMDNSCTKAFIRYYESNEASLSGDDKNKYYSYLRINGDDKTISRVMEESMRKSLKKDHNRRFLDGVDNGEGLSDAYFYQTWFSNNAVYFSFIDDAIPLSRKLIDTMFLSCLDNDSIINYSDLAKCRIYAKDYERALSDAQKAISRKERFAENRLIEALYLNGQYEDAFNRLIESKNSIINWVEYNNKDEMVSRYKYLGDAVWQDMVEYKRLRILQDTLSPQYKNLENVLMLEMTHPYYDYAIGLQNVVWNAKGWALNNDYELFICKGVIDDYHDGSFYNNYSFIVCNNVVISPIMKSFALSEDEKNMLIVDAVDNKRKYIDLTGDTLQLLSGEYDHAWRFSEGLAVVSVNNKIGVINKEGDFIISPVFSMPYYRCYGTTKLIVDDLLSVKSDDVYSRENHWFTDFVFQNGLCPMSDENGYFGLINERGEWVVDPIYDYIGKPNDMGNRVVVRDLKEMPYWITRSNIRNPKELSYFDDPDRWTVGEIDRYGNYCPIKQR